MSITAASAVQAAQRAREVIYSSECSCENDHGVARWRAKTDPSEPPPNPRDIRPITPSEIFSWEGPGIIPRGGGRTGNELRWFALTGRVVSMAAESDGDVHIVLVDAEGDKPGRVIAEIPLGMRWCGLRTTAFSWTNAVFPFTADWQSSPFRLIKHPVITVVGKAFYDTDHSGKNIRNNRRPRDKDKAVWEIHPVMKMEVAASQQPAQPPAPAAVRAAVPQPPQPSAPPQPAVPPAPAPGKQLVQIVQPVRVKISYGEAVIPAGMKLEMVGRDAANVRVLWMGETLTIPLTSTDLQ